MVKFLSRFPDDAPGAGLLLLRFSCAFAAYPVLERLPLPHPVLLLVLLPAVALALASGFGTRTVVLVLAVTALATAPTGADGAFTAIAQAGDCGALALLGPGAYSIDAKVFGRRVVRFESRRPGSRQN